MPGSSAVQPSALGQRATSRLRASPYLALRNVSCEERDGTLILQGCVPTYYLKQLAQALVAETEGVEHVINAIDVSSCVPGMSHGKDRHRR